VLACADYGIRATQLTWASWSQTSASGVGVISEDNCTPNCAEGKFLPYPATFELSGLAIGSGEPVFTNLQVDFTAGSPDVDGRTSDNFPLPVNPES
jgi:hypothetical protein